MQQVLDQRQGLGVVESAVAEDFSHDAGAFLVGSRYETTFRLVIAGLEGRHHPARQGLRLVAQVGLVALELWPTEAHRAADPEFQIRQVAAQQRSLAAFRHVAGVDGGEQGIQRWPGFGALLGGEKNLAEADELLHRLGLHSLPCLQAAFRGIDPDAIWVGRVGDAGFGVEQWVVEIWPLLVGIAQRQIAGSPIAARILVRVAVHLVALGKAVEGKTGVAIDQHMLVVDAQKALLVSVRPLPRAPGDAAQPPPRHHFIHQQLQPRPVFVVDRDQDHAVRGQQVARQAQPAVEEFQPLRMPPAVVGTDVVVVVHPILVAGVVGRVDVDDADFAGVRGLQQAQGVEVVALDDQVSRLAIAPCARFGNQAGQHAVFVERRIAFDGVGFPGQAELLLGQLLDQQATQLCGVEVFQLRQQAAGMCLWHVHGALFCQCLMRCLIY